MRNIVAITVSCLFVAFSCNNSVENNRTSILGEDSSKSKSILQLPELINLGEPSGKEIEQYDFYLVFTHSKAFKNFKVFSLRQKDSLATSFYKVLPTRNVPFLRNDRGEDTAISYISFYKMNDVSTIDTIRHIIKKLKLYELSNVKYKMPVVFDGSYFTVIVYDRGTFFAFSRLENDPLTEDEVVSFFKDLKDMVYSAFPP